MTQETRGSAPAPHDYILGVDEDERARLLAQAELHAPEARAMLDRIGVAPGWHTIDVGCGPLGILDLLAERVGPTGTVVGLDRDQRMLAMASQSLAERELHHVRLVQTPISEIGVAETFDLCHSRLVLVHTPDPTALVAEMVAITRPGGWVALEEIDWISWACEPPHPGFERLVDALTRVWDRSGMDVHIGRRAQGMLRSAGLRDVDTRAHQKLCRPGDLNQTMILRFAAIARERLLTAGEFTPAELDAVVAELAEHLARPGTIVLDKLLFQAWGRRPG